MPRRKRLDTPFGKNLRTVLEKRGLSIRAAAEICGVPPSVISDWCNGAVPHNLSCVQRICRATGADFEWMLTGQSTRLDPENLPISALFEQQETGLNGLYWIDTKKLVRKAPKPDPAADRDEKAEISQ